MVWMVSLKLGFRLLLFIKCLFELGKALFILSLLFSGCCQTPHEKLSGLNVMLSGLGQQRAEERETVR